MGDTIVHGTGLAHPEAVLLTDPDIVPALVPLADAIKRHGAVASIEIDHGGGKANPLFTSDHISHAPSRIYNAAGDYWTEEMSLDLIHTLTEAYGAGAAAAKLAGFQMVTLHAGHGWLVNQFLSPLTNHRTDEYGGSFENRCRFMLETIASIRAHCGPNFPIEVRMSGTELADELGGYTLKDGVEIAKVLDGKVDLIHVSTGGGSAAGGTIMHPAMFFEHGCNVYLAEEIKKHVKTPVATVGALSDPVKMEEIVAQGRADIVCMARALIADPFLPSKVMDNRPEEVRPCLRCFTCQGGMFVTRNMRCSVNPVIGHELHCSIPVPRTEPKTVLIAGGGPAGMEAAITAAERGHRVILCEKDSELGGATRYARYVSFKGQLELFRQYLIRRLTASGAEVRLNTAVTPELCRAIAPDMLLCAIGAQPIVPRIAGIDAPFVIPGKDAHQQIDSMGNTVVIIGGGLVGTELAIELGLRGTHPIVVEMQGDYAVDSNPQHKNAIHYHMEKYVDFRLNTTCIEVTPAGVRVRDKDGRESMLAADSIVSAVGYRALSEQVEALRPCAPRFRWIGDCYQPGKVTDAVSSGYFAALDI